MSEGFIAELNELDAAALATAISTAKGGNEPAVAYLREVISSLGGEAITGKTRPLEDDDETQETSNKSAKTGESSTAAGTSSSNQNPPVELPKLLDYFKDEEWTNNEYTLLMVVPNTAQMYRSVIGKGGSTIIELQKLAGARVRIDKEEANARGTPDVKVTVSGTIRACNIAQQMLHDRFCDDSRTVKLIIPHSAVRFVIGKGGSVVKRLEADSGAQMRIEPETEIDTLFGGRRISIIGSARAVSICQYLVSHTLAEPRVAMLIAQEERERFVPNSLLGPGKFGPMGGGGGGFPGPRPPMNGGGGGMGGGRGGPPLMGLGGAGGGGGYMGGGRGGGPGGFGGRGGGGMGRGGMRGGFGHPNPGYGPR